jgi:hypothetical protein
MTYENTVIVAIDDEEPDMLLLGWAAAEAASRGTRLVVCHVCEWQPGDQAPQPMNEGGDPNLRLGPERVVGAALDVVRAAYPDLQVSGVIGTGSPQRRADRRVGQPAGDAARALPSPGRPLSPHPTIGRVLR